MPLNVMGKRRSPAYQKIMNASGNQGEPLSFFTTRHADDRRFCVKDTRDVLSAEGSRADAVAVRPTVVTESAEEIPQRVIPGPDLEFARAAAGRKSLGVKRDARQQRLGENKKQQPET